MAAFQSILVDVDASAQAHPALERAAALARAANARLTVVDVITVPAGARRRLPAKAEEALMDSRRRKLEHLARGLTDCSAGSSLLTGRPATALIREVLRSNHDLLVRSHARDLTAWRPFGAVDMELVRQCPCPVMLVGPGARSARPRIVAAVDAGAEDEVEQRLNARIVELTLLLSRLEHGTPEVLHAWNPFGDVLLADCLADDDYSEYVETVRRSAAEDLVKLAQRFQLTPGQATLERGAPDDVIPDYAISEGIDLVVIGTVARGGIAGFLIGNTAERILRKLPCSVLTVKPDDFRCPVRLEES